MKQLQYRRRGGPEVLSFAEAPTPIPRKGEVVIDVRAASVNPSDTKVRTGELAYLTAFRRRPWGMGLEAAGIVTHTGSGSKFAIGDRIFGMAKESKGFADAAVINERNAVLIPEGLSFSEAACIAMAGGMATAMTAKLKLAPRKRVFVNGAAGGIGLFLVQLLSQSGVSVVGTSSASGIDVVLKAGAEEAHDYRVFDIAAHQGRYDVVLDLSGTMTFATSRLIMNDRATFHTLTPTRSFMTQVLGTIARKQKARALFVLPRTVDISRLAEGISQGASFVQIGAEVPLEEAIATMTQLETRILTPVGKVTFTR
jgi:NADPH:quinone reductase-like Zn-dependent oxidoreductase